MSAIAKRFGARVIKNGGDSLLFYFPDTSDDTNRFAFKDVLECCTSMIETRELLNSQMREHNLPPIDYRISADYGKVEIAACALSNS